MGRILNALLKAGTTDKRWGNKDNWDQMGLKEMKPKIKGKKKK